MLLHDAELGNSIDPSMSMREYKKENGRWFKSRKDMDDSLDFLGWYTDRIHRELGISKWDPKHLYLAYHEGSGGYRTG